MSAVPKIPPVSKLPGTKSDQVHFNLSLLHKTAPDQTSHFSLDFPFRLLVLAKANDGTFEARWDSDGDEGDSRAEVVHCKDDFCQVRDKRERKLHVQADPWFCKRNKL